MVIEDGLVPSTKVSHIIFTATLANLQIGVAMKLSNFFERHPGLSMQPINVLRDDEFQASLVFVRLAIDRNKSYIQKMHQGHVRVSRQCLDRLDTPVICGPISPLLEAHALRVLLLPLAWAGLKYSALR